MRIAYADEEEYQGQFELWQANCRRSLNGHKGQAVLRELERALLALPTPRLIEGSLANEQGEVCAVGALLAYRRVLAGKDWGSAAQELSQYLPDYLATDEIAAKEGVPRLVAWKLVELNDMELGEWELRGVTPEVRFQKVLAWVRRQLHPGKARME